MSAVVDARPTPATRQSPADRATGTQAGRFLRRFGRDRNAVLERQLCTAAVYLLSYLMFLVTGISVRHWEPVLAGATIIAGATIAAFVLRAAENRRYLVMLIPLAGILAVGLLRAGTGGTGSVFTIMLVLPVLSLGVEPGRLPMLLGGPVTLLAMLLPMRYEPLTLANGQWMGVIYTPLILGLACLSINELARRLRSRIRAVQRLRIDQEHLLAEAQDHAAVTAAGSALLRESTNQLRSVVDSVTEQSIIATDPSGRIDVFNAGAQRMLGVAAHDAIGHNITDFHLEEELRPPGGPGAGEGRPADPVGAGQAESADSILNAPPEGRFEALVAPLLRGHAHVRDWTYVKSDGTSIRVQVAATPRRDAAGDIDGFLFVATDVTRDREQARMKDEFFNLISHELRTPLSSILGYLELVADDEENPLSDEQQQYLATIQRNANRLLQLVSDLLFTAQVESGRFHLQEQVVDLAQAVASAIASAEPAARSRTVRLQGSYTPTPLQVWADPVRLGQALDNLISNAIKFTPAGGRVAVTVGLDEEERRALVVVSDTGVGIPPDELDRLGSRFFRASTATKHAVPGVGGGLTITRAIVQAHRGEIRVASTVGEGTSFTIDLPVAAPSVARSAD